jgi:hypothetical protein
MSNTIPVPGFENEEKTQYSSGQVSYLGFSYQPKV